MNLSTTTPASLNKQQSAIVFLIHGTRNVQAGQVIHQSMVALKATFADSVGLPEDCVAYGFLEIMEPSLPQALETFCQQGKTDIRIVPLLLFPGSHLNQDIPEIADELMKRYPTVTIRTGNCIGVNDPEFLAILMKRL